MREVHLRNVDLNLLRALYALLQERHVSHAAKCSFLSQPAMGRATGPGYAKHSEILSSFAQDAFMRGRRAEIQESPRAVGQTSARRVVSFAGHFSAFMPFASQSFITLSLCRS